jgi:hypothetical protein
VAQDVQVMPFTVISVIFLLGALKSEVQHLTRGKVLHDSNEEVRAFAA